MQTSSCDKFNETFRHMQNAAEYDKTLKKSITVQYPDPDQILEAAENKYVQLTSLQQWDGVTTKGSPSGFILGNSNRTCFNCGDPGHIVPTCTKPKNEELIQKRRKEFQDKKAASKKQNLSQNTSTKNSNDRKNSNRPGKGKWTPPKQGEGPRRVIDNKPMFYNKGSRDGSLTRILLLAPPKVLIKQPMRLLLRLHLLPLLPLLLHLATSQLAILQLIKLPSAMRLISAWKQ